MIGTGIGTGMSTGMGTRMGKLQVWALTLINYTNLDLCGFNLDLCGFNLDLCGESLRNVEYFEKLT